MLPSLTRVSTGTLIVAALFLSTCSPPPPREGVSPMQAHMYAHFDRAGEMHDALVKGDLDEAQSAAHWIATHPERSDFSGRSVYLQDAMRAFASEVDNAEVLSDATSAAARMGQACGDCHRENEIEPRFLIGTAPPTGSGPQAEMARHVWAEERMWEGLVGPGDRAWTTGAEALRSGWLNIQEVVLDPDDRPAIHELVKSVYDLAVQAGEAKTSNERALLFGEFLNTCAECHRLTEAKIG
jgi:mono/diheme cytochrome c family protein